MDNTTHDIAANDSTHVGNLSYFLGGKAATDGDDWTPDLRAVRAVIKFAITTGRLNVN
jgi:hypothetical protein